MTTQPTTHPKAPAHHPVSGGPPPNPPHRNTPTPKSGPVLGGGQGVARGAGRTPAGARARHGCPPRVPATRSKGNWTGPGRLARPGPVCCRRAASMAQSRRQQDGPAHPGAGHGCGGGARRGAARRRGRPRRWPRCLPYRLRWGRAKGKVRTAAGTGRSGPGGALSHIRVATKVAALAENDGTRSRAKRPGQVHAVLRDGPPREQVTPRRGPKHGNLPRPAHQHPPGPRDTPLPPDGDRAAGVQTRSTRSTAPERRVGSWGACRLWRW